MSAVLLRRLLAGGLLLLGAAAAYWVHARSGLELDPEVIRARIQAVGPLAPAAFVGLMALRPLLALPSWMFMVAAGLIFGTVAGTLWATVGGTLGGLAAFGVARALGQDAVQQRLKGPVAALDRRLAERGAAWLGVYTAVPLSVLTPAHLASGVSSMAFAPFLGATLAGLVPRCALFAYFGSIALDPSGRDLAIASALVVLAFVAMRSARRYLAPRD